MAFPGTCSLSHWPWDKSRNNSGPSTPSPFIRELHFLKILLFECFSKCTVCFVWQIQWLWLLLLCLPCVHTSISHHNSSQVDQTVSVCYLSGRQRTVSRLLPLDHPLISTWNLSNPWGVFSIVFPSHYSVKGGSPQIYTASYLVTFQMFFKNLFKVAKFVVYNDDT